MHIIVFFDNLNTDILSDDYRLIKREERIIRMMVSDMLTHYKTALNSIQFRNYINLKLLALAFRSSLFL